MEATHLLIAKYFDLTEEQSKLFKQMYQLYKEWNDQINVVSRKTFEAFYVHHVLHSLSILKCVQFKAGTQILDLGTGGGFPGIPMAVMLPEVDFMLIDGRRKKIKVVNAVAQSLGLKNVKAQHIRAEELKGKYHYVVSRAVTDIATLAQWSRRLISTEQLNPLPNGLICLKGGNPKKEIKLLHKSEYTETYWLSDIFEEDYYKEKYILYLQL